jgi:hypothetical protein
VEQVDQRSSESDFFSDQNLKVILNKHSRGVFYFWSPHMVLSIQGIQKIEQLCKKYRIHLTVLLDPDADPIEAQDAQKKFKLNSSYLLRNESEDLFSRGARLHYPNLMLYRDGEILRGNLPGFKSQTSYDNYIRGNLLLNHKGK